MGVFSDFFSGIIGPVVDVFNADRKRDQDRSWANEQTRESERFQKEMASTGIQMRVKDAEAAGVHPLFALGASGASGSIAPMPASSGIGDDVGTKVGNFAASQTKSARAITQAQLDQLRSQSLKDLAEGQYYASLAAKVRQSNTQSAPFPDVGDDYTPAFVSGNDSASPVIRHYKDEVSEALVKSSPESVPGYGPQESALDLHIAPGKTAAWSRWQMDKGMEMLLPYAGGQGGSLAESMEGIPATAWPIIIEMNRKTYGSGWFDKFARLYPGYASLASKSGRAAKAIKRGYGQSIEDPGMQF